MSPHESLMVSLIRTLRLPALAALSCVGTALGQPLIVNSPFSSVGSQGVGAAGPAEAYELAGSTVAGPDVTVCIFERQKKRSAWIPVGGDEDGVRVVSFDALHDTAVVVIGGARKELSLRKSVVSSLYAASGARAPAPVAEPAPALVPISSAPAPASTATAAQDQREARMLVSDLLEIGVQQRKAYQDAKQKAASGTPAPVDN
jgi:hypothetical protein